MLEIIAMTVLLSITITKVMIDYYHREDICEHQENERNRHLWEKRVDTLICKYK
jgi:hypothetical protein